MTTPRSVSATLVKHTVKERYIIMVSAPASIPLVVVVLEGFYSSHNIVLG